MNGYTSKSEIEKVKPLKERAAHEATRLINLREAMRTVLGQQAQGLCAVDEAIKVLLDVAERNGHSEHCAMMKPLATTPIMDFHGKVTGRMLVGPNPGVRLPKCTCGALS